MTHLVINGTERWYDADGHKTHTKLPDGAEYWYDADGHCTQIKRAKK